MKRLALASAIAGMMAVPISGHTAVLFDADGSGTATAQTIDAFDWNFSSFLADGGQTAIQNWITSGGVCSNSSCNFDVYTHATLSSASLDGNLVNLGFSGELTLIMKFTETVTSVGVNGETFAENVANFSTVPGSGWVEVYYGSTANSNALTGFGFNDGQLILSGLLVNSSSGSFTVDRDQTDGSNLITKYDSQGTDNYDSDTTDATIEQFTVTGRGDQGNLSFENLVTDSSFFLTGLATFGIQFSNISVNLPYVSTNPSDCFTATNAGQGSVGTNVAAPAGSCDNTHVASAMSAQTDAGANAIVPDIGPTNGLLTAGINFGPDFTAQTDFNSSLVAAVPEPGTVALLGMGLLGLGLSVRRKQNTTVKA